jgi:lysyl-tRNA synthetase class 1
MADTAAASGAQPWPFVEAEALLRSLQGRPPAQTVLFETGYGPSGLPHIGTFAEVARTTFIRRAFEALAPGRPTQLVAFSDDMDGLRKVPLNIPEPERFREHLGKPLSSIPDPFGTDPSWSAHMNRRLREFLDSFGFDYTFRSSTEQYKAGAFDESLKLILAKVDDVLALILPTLRDESREGWSPFMVVCPSCARNLTTTVVGYHPDRDSVSFRCDGARSENIAGCGASGESLVTGGRVKVGWKVDWALRWFTFGIHYEMYGKDLIESAQLSARIVRTLGGTPPQGLFYEMFLDDDGKKISKSIGKGISVDRWQTYAPVESLLAFLYQNPKKARRLHYDVIPQACDEYLGQLRDWEGQDELARKWNPAWFYFGHRQERPRWASRLDYSLVRNLVVCMGKDEPDAVLDYLRRYDAQVAAPDHEGLSRALIRGAIAYDRDWEAGKRVRQAPPAALRPALLAIADGLEAHPGDDPKPVQDLVFALARAHGSDPKDVFVALYRGLIGQDRGPRFGSFALALGLRETAAAIRRLASESPTPTEISP